MAGGNYRLIRVRISAAIPDLLNLLPLQKNINVNFNSVDMQRLILVVATLLLLLTPAGAQTGKKPLDHDAIEAWRRITTTVLSPDGKFVAYVAEPWKGDGELFVYRSDGEIVASFCCASSPQFSSDSRLLIFEQQPAESLVRELKLKKTKKEDMPLKKTVIYDPVKGEIVKQIERSVRVTVPSEWSGWIAWQAEPEAVNAEGSQGKEENGDKTEGKRESAKNGYHLNLFNTSGAESVTLPFVKSYIMAEDVPAVMFVTGGDGDSFEEGAYIFFPGEGRTVELLKGKGEFSQMIIRSDAAAAAFLFSSDGSEKDGGYTLWHWNGDSGASLLADNSVEGLSDGWKISENGRLMFSDNGKRIFLGTAPVMPEKDTTILEEEFPDVDIWHGTEGTLHTVQVVNRNRTLRRTWMGMADIETGTFVQLATPEVPDIQLVNKGDSDWAVATTDVPYELQSMWEGGPSHIDLYLINCRSGERRLLKKDIRASVSVSPAGKYIAWYDYITESWYTMDIATQKERRITTPETLAAAQELNDVPNLRGPYRPTGWLENDAAALLNDRYDIWLVDPAGDKDPVNLTLNGREKRITYSAVQFDRDKESFREGEEVLLMGSNEVTRESGYYNWKAGSRSAPQELKKGAYNLSVPVKAEEDDAVVYSRETFGMFPDLWITDLKFKREKKISDVNPQQKDFIWGTAELVSWTSLDGLELEGLLYKPEGFDPSRKYPLIVNFYEKSSSELYSYRTPELHRSTIDYHYYTSNGYLVFNPDVWYEDGYPGESAFNCVMPGITALIEKGFVDRNRIGAQGHSWGGYQVAYLATRTDIFAAIESGAPVVNMFSAYGGIRWATGLNRSFQYEHTQSRIGATIWESPLRYLENSPLFTMDKVTTPILIMHNDSDGHVPWYQGIEYFIALRRLNKPVWMLNYTGEPHWPQKMPNKKDFQIRMSQFFNHYLKGEPMPVWMKEGVPAIMKEYDLGYELVK